MASPNPASPGQGSQRQIQTFSAVCLGKKKTAGGKPPAVRKLDEKTDYFAWVGMGVDVCSEVGEGVTVGVGIVSTIAIETMLSSVVS